MTKLGIVTWPIAHGRQVTAPRGLFAASRRRPYPRHEGKAPPPNEATESGMLTEDRLKQDTNAPLPIEVTESGKVTEDRLVHPKKAPTPMLVTALAMVIVDRVVQLRNANSSMLVIELGILTWPKASGVIRQTHRPRQTSRHPTNAVNSTLNGSLRIVEKIKRLPSEPTHVTVE